MKSKQVSKRLNNRRPNNAYLLVTASRPRPQVRSAGSRGFAGTPGHHVEKKDGVAQGERARADGVEASKLGACTKFNWETAFVRPHVRPFLQQVFRGRRRGTRCQDARAEAERPESLMAPSGRAQGGWARAQPGGRRGAERDPEVWADSRVRGAGGRHSTLVAGGDSGQSSGDRCVHRAGDQGRAWRLPKRWLVCLSSSKTHFSWKPDLCTKRLHSRQPNS